MARSSTILLSPKTSARFTASESAPIIKDKLFFYLPSDRYDKDYPERPANNPIAFFASPIRT